MDAMRGSSPPKAAPSADSPEQLLDAFRAAALSVTKLYKTSASAQAKSRSDGYQDCLDDLLTFLDKRNIGLGDGEGWQIRKWATERLDGKDLGPQTSDDEEEADKPEMASATELRRSNSSAQSSSNESAPPVSQPPAVVEPIAEEPQMITVPSQDTFTFQSSHPYPQESSYLNIANLDLSDSRHNLDNTNQGPPVSHATRLRKDRRHQRPRNQTPNHLGRGAGQKRPINFAELFDVGGLNFGKDSFGREGKRTRHT
ncbi:hypothetical protein F5Y08DRAFT_310457 [Xylaria arbuscula]|uniref:Uncharacterized protein n=1 Tax=Xylaria arbuscula TaxID=114810 RepID=A0A9W8NF14_9PEZI|nr:hypothetical protein F5Y08DRAFT_310457 [Xylaria arbuscula]KAJ3573445.1 hypothetical protein NPX13_g4700 [Xylaria arbuscula]